MRTLRLAWLLSRPGANSMAVTVLPIVAFGVVTTLLLTVLGGAHAFFSWTDDTAPLYQILAIIALALLVVPLAALGGSAARLSARRRDDRLATMRLLGATPATVAALTVLESTVLALAGAVLGVVGYLIVAPFVGMIPFRGEALGSALWLEAWTVLAVVAGVAVLAAVSAVVGLRGVIISPLGVRTKQKAQSTHWVRLAIGVVVVFATFAGMVVLRAAPGVVFVLAFMAVGFGGSIAVLNLVGPFVVGRMARRQVVRAKTPQRLLAARSILESPKAAWRQVGGVAMTSFMAVFAGVGVALADAVSGGAHVDRKGMMLFLDMRTGVIITVVASFLMVACSVGVNQASSILDRRDLYVSLDRLGMPVETMDAARSRAVMSPLRITAIGSALTAAIVILPLTGFALLMAPLSILVIAGCLAAGIAIVWLGLRATRPILLRVLAEPDRT